MPRTAPLQGLRYTLVGDGAKEPKGPQHTIQHAADNAASPKEIPKDLNPNDVINLLGKNKDEYNQNNQRTCTGRHTHTL